MLRNTKFVRGLVNTHNKQSIARISSIQKVNTYATVKSAQLEDSVKSVLKPEVLKVIEGKTDALLVKKLNFLGKYLVCRLNVASKLILNSLTQENCFRIVINELSDPWVYYWKNVKKNEKDDEKWLESLREVVDLPLIADRCWRVMLTSGVYPTTAHYNAYLEALANTSDSHSLHENIDDLKRRNTYYDPDEKTDNLVLLNYLNHDDPYRSKLQLENMKSRNIAVESALEERVKQLAPSFNAEEGAKWALNLGGQKPEYELKKEQTQETNQKKIFSNLEKYIQPSFEKLVVKE